MEVSQKTVVIPPYGKTLLVAIGLIFLGIICYMEYYINGRDFLYYANWFLGVGIILFIDKSFHTAITEKGLQIRFLYIPIYRIRWNKISTAQYICSWKATERGSEEKGNGIFITLPTCPAFIPEVDGLDMFRLKHPFSSFFIQFTEKNKRKYVSMFCHYYPNLFFQVGCDTVVFDNKTGDGFA